VRKLQLHLTLAPDAELTSLVEELLAPASVVARRSGASYRIAVRDTATSFFPVPPGRPQFDAHVEVALPRGASDDELLEHAAALQPTVARLVDPSSSAAVLGQEEIVTPGVAPLQLFWCMRRRAHLTHDQFVDYWLRVHGDFGRRHPGAIGSRQLVADPDASAAAAKVAGVALGDFDGVAQVFFAGPAQMAQHVPSDAYLAAIELDGAVLSDRERGMGGLAHVIATLESPLLLPDGD